MKSRIVGILLAACILGTTGYAEDAQKEGKLAFVDAGKWIYMREKATTDSKAVAILDDHASVYIYEEIDGGWVEVVSGEYRGYVKKERLATGEKAEEIAAEEGREVGIVHSEALNIRYAPNVGEPIDVTYKGQELAIQGRDGDWLKVVTPAGVEGYVHSKYCDNVTVYLVARAIDKKEAAKAVDSQEKNVIPVGCGEMTKEDLWKEIYGDQPVVDKKEDKKAEVKAEEPQTEAPQVVETQTEAPQVVEPQTEAPETENAWVADVQTEAPLTDSSWVEEPQTESSWIEEPQTENSWIEAPQTESSWEDVPQVEESWQETWTEAQQEETSWVETPQVETSWEAPQTSPSSTNGQAIVDYATQFVGNKYVWGGTDPVTGSDCSGFTQAVYNNFGISIPRVAEYQKVAGTEVSMEEAQVGDLLFFGQEGGEADHVAIYMGNNMIIHSSSEETGVIISDVSYGGNLIGAATYNVNNDYY